MAKRIRVLVIDKNRLAREGLGVLIGAASDLRVVATAEDTTAGVDRLLELTPHIVLVDAELDNGDSYRSVERLRQAAPNTRVIVTDLVPAVEPVIEFVKAGANGFVMKDATVEDLVSTIRSVALGADVVPPALTGRLLSHIAHQTEQGRPPAVAEEARMTKREREITNLIAEGLSNKEIAQRLCIATYTVKTHVHNILEKLALHTRLQIAAYSHRTEAAVSLS